RSSELSDLVKKSRAELNSENVSWAMLETRLRYRWIDDLCKKAVRQAGKEKQTFSEKMDRVLTHRVAGPVIFLLVFATIFQSIFTWAEIPMNGIEMLIAWLSAQVSSILPEGVLQDLIINGALAGVGAILVFLPQILFLFFFLSLLEDSGYMARVAFMMDRVMRPTGLSGRSVIPLLSSFACAIPGIMATRTIQNWRERLITILIAPLMTCSARLPVYTLMIAAFIPAIAIWGIFPLQALALLAMYLLGILAAFVAGFFLQKFIVKGKKRSTFVMELPPYRVPSLKWTFFRMAERAKLFVTEAGKIILSISIVLWFLASYPKPDPAANMRPAEAIKQSYAGRIGQIMEPVIAPLGFDWKMGIGLVTSFAAREVLVSTLATIYNVEGADETSHSLRETLRNERDPETGKPVYTSLVAISLMVFFAFACQCMSTVAIVRRETNSWRWPLVMIAYMTILAYLGSLVVYQGGKFFGLG
ncbi:MAG: ferrous iron transport protein B, partial [bacterium]